MKNLVIDNLLSQNSIFLIKDLIEFEVSREDIWVPSYADYSTKSKKQYLEKKHDTVGIRRSDFARIDLNNLKISKTVTDEISIKLLENNLLGYKYCGSSTAWLYNKNLGNPKLTDHIDSTEDENTIMVDYQLEGNTSWAIRVENNDYTLLNNQALVFWGKKQRHSRPFKKFNEGEFLTNVLFRFNPNENVYS
jgi:hypothetical protein